MKTKDIDEQAFIEYYLKPGVGCRNAHTYFHIGRNRAKEILKKYNIPIKSRGEIIGDINRGGKLTKEHKEKIRNSLIGRPSPMKGRRLSEERKQKIREKNKGSGNPFYGKKHSLETKIKMSKNHADVSRASGHPLQSPESKEKARLSRIKNKKPLSEKARINKSLAMVKYIQNNPEKIVNKNSKRGWFLTYKYHKLIYYRSSYELRMLKIWDDDDNVVQILPESISLPYYDKDVLRNFIVDFMLIFSNGEDKLVEIKPKNLLTYNNNPLKIETLQMFCQCMDMDYEIITLEDIERYEKIGKYVIA